MALTEQRKRELDEIARQRRESFLGIQSEAPTPQRAATGEVKRGFFGKSADAINRAYDWYREAPGVRHAGAAVGAVTGLAGEVIGSGIGTAGQFVQNLATGQPLGRDVLEASERTARDTKELGTEIGREGAIAAPLGAAGRAITVPLAYSQTYGGVEQVIEGVKEDDAKKVLAGGVQAGVGLFAAKTALKNKGFLITDEAQKFLAQKYPAASGIINTANRPLLSAQQALGKAGQKLTTKALIKVYDDALNLNARQTRLQNKGGKNLPQYAMDEQLPLSVEKGGRLNTEAAQNAVRMKAQAENATFHRLLVDSGAYASLDDLHDDAVRIIRDTAKAKGADSAKMIKHVDDDFAALINNYADEVIDVDGKSMVPIAIVDDIKKERWFQTKRDFGAVDKRLLDDADYIVGKVSKDAIEKAIDDADIAKFNNRLGDHAFAMRMLKERNGQKVVGGRTGLGFGQLLGWMSGKSLAGRVTGAITGNQLAAMMQDPNVKIGVLRAVMGSLDDPAGQAIIDEAQDILIRRASERATRKLLTAPNYEVMPPKTDTSGILKQADIPPESLPVGAVGRHGPKAPLIPVGTIPEGAPHAQGRLKELFQVIMDYQETGKQPPKFILDELKNALGEASGS